MYLKEFQQNKMQVKFNLKKYSTCVLSNYKNKYWIFHLTFG